MALLALLTVVCIVAYTIEIVFGFAGTILMVVAMGIFIEPKTLVVYSVLPQVLTATIALARSPRTVRIGYLARMLAFAAVGAVAGLYLFYFFSPQAFERMLAAAVTLFGVYLVVAPGKLRLPPPFARLLDMFAGASQTLFGISGPIVMTRLMATVGGKTEVRNYALAFFLSINVLRLGGYLWNGTIDADVRQMMLVSAPFLAVALWYSNHLHMKVDEMLFRRVVSWVVLGGGIAMFF
jgi:uncharacterized membrane protein YfcA